MFTLFGIHKFTGEALPMGEYRTTMELEDMVEIFDVVYSASFHEMPVSINSDAYHVYYRNEAGATFLAECTTQYGVVWTRTI